MDHRVLSLTLLSVVLWVGGGCDSGQDGQGTPPTPQAENTSMPIAEVPPSEEVQKMEGPLLADEGEGGAAEIQEGVTHYQQDHWEVAQNHFNKALAANVELPEAHYNLALVLDKLGKHGEATQHFKTALELAPEDPRIRDSKILHAHVGP